MAPAHPHATGVAVYPALFSSQTRDQLQFLNNVNRRMNQIRGYFEDLLPEVPSEAARVALEEHEKDVNDQLIMDDEFAEDVEDYGDDFAVNIDDIFD